MDDHVIHGYRLGRADLPLSIESGMRGLSASDLALAPFRETGVSTELTELIFVVLV